MGWLGPANFWFAPIAPRRSFGHSQARAYVHLSPTSLELFLALCVYALESYAMRKNAAYYRGYRIEGEKERQGWLLRISPERPDLPILPRSEFRTREKIWPLAIADGVARINALLPAR
jgi:hypothetical protein